MTVLVSVYQMRQCSRAYTHPNTYSDVWAFVGKNSAFLHVVRTGSITAEYSPETLANTDLRMYI